MVDGQKFEIFDNRRVLEDYSQADVTVLRQACQVLRREFIEIGNIEVFIESITIASACNKVLRRRFLKPHTIGLIPAGGYTGNIKYSKKAIMLYRVQRESRRLQNYARPKRTRVQTPRAPTSER
jgi:hypothetical protein